MFPANKDHVSIFEIFNVPLLLVETLLVSLFFFFPSITMNKGISSKIKLDSYPDFFFPPHFSHLLYTELLFFFNFLKLPPCNTQKPSGTKKKKHRGKEMRALTFV